MDELRKQIDELFHQLNQCTVPCGGVHTCFSIGPPICPENGFVDEFTPNSFGNSGRIQFVSGVDGPLL